MHFRYCTVCLIFDEISNKKVPYKRATTNYENNEVNGKIAVLDYDKIIYSVKGSNEQKGSCGANIELITE